MRVRGRGEREKGEGEREGEEGELEGKRYTLTPSVWICIHD